MKLLQAEMGQDKEEKKGLFQARSPSFSGKGRGSLTSADQEIPDWLAETAMRLGIKCGGA